jgi:tRNA-modifying protein YgfZ
MDLREYHVSSGAKVADDGIPLHYTDLLTEYSAALEGGVLLDRSHEARLRLRGNDRAALLHRISTNDMLSMKVGEGRPTIFTSSTARILDRALVYNAPNDSLTLIGGPGRGDALRNYLQRNIFFRDDVKIEDLHATTRQFSLHGINANAVIETLYPNAKDLPALYSTEATIAGANVFLARRKPYIGSHWSVIAPAESAVEVWKAILGAGEAHGVIAAGSLTFNTLRIRAARPGFGRELTEDYIPLELGLWDEVSFTKGCYTGQEIIARMESRNRLAKTLVSLNLPQLVDVPADLFHDNKRIGTLTSSVKAPDGTVYAMGVVKPSLAVRGQTLTVGGQTATVVDLPGVQPPMLEETEG